ncbi:hypothetical protein Lepto7375DRAFT_2616 [Leptolyngbya sp. PCC 7375]|nr:hypothetical protein Lepto7375DRAFT_2616 [Leptolyngbya sp. PCC 7375]
MKADARVMDFKLRKVQGIMSDAKADHYRDFWETLWLSQTPIAQ